MGVSGNLLIHRQIVIIVFVDLTFMMEIVKMTRPRTIDRMATAVATYVWGGKIMHEFDSLSREKFSVQDDSLVVWESKKELSFVPFPDVPDVEASEAGRSRRLKSMASQFAVTMLGWRRDLSDKELLRRMPRELYRYKPQSEDCLDGVLFTYALETDSEAILSIEAIKQKDKTE